MPSFTSELRLSQYFISLAHDQGLEARQDRWQKKLENAFVLAECL